MKRPALPPRLDPREVENLPDAPGVYLFHGDNDALLYIGKSIHLRTRVLSHFAARHSSRKALKIARQVRRIETIRTAADLGACLLEARLIKERQPLYNRQLRRQRQLFFFILETDREGFLTLRLALTAACPEYPSDCVVGPFKSKRSAEAKLRDWSHEHGLCDRLTGLEKKGSGPCFAYQLKRCRGACCGHESASAYNLRLREILAHWTFKVWPYQGPRIIEDAGRDMTDYHLVDQWCHLDTQPAPELLSAPANRPRRLEYDTYKILTRALLS